MERKPQTVRSVRSGAILLALPCCLILFPEADRATENAVSWKVQDTKTVVRNVSGPQYITTVRVHVGPNNRCSAKVSYHPNSAFHEGRDDRAAEDGRIDFPNSPQASQVRCRVAGTQANRAGSRRRVGRMMSAIVGITGAAVRSSPRVACIVIAGVTACNAP